MLYQSTIWERERQHALDKEGYLRSIKLHAFITKQMNKITRPQSHRLSHPPLDTIETCLFPKWLKSGEICWRESAGLKISLSLLRSPADCDDCWEFTWKMLILWRNQKLRPPSKKSSVLLLKPKHLRGHKFYSKSGLSFLYAWFDYHVCFWNSMLVKVSHSVHSACHAEECHIKTFSQFA